MSLHCILISLNDNRTDISNLIFVMVSWTNYRFSIYVKNIKRCALHLLDNMYIYQLLHKTYLFFRFTFNKSNLFKMVGLFEYHLGYNCTIYWLFVLHLDFKSQMEWIAWIRLESYYWDLCRYCVVKLGYLDSSFDLLMEWLLG